MLNNIKMMLHVFLLAYSGILMHAVSSQPSCSPSACGEPLADELMNESCREDEAGLSLNSSSDDEAGMFSDVNEEGGLSLGSSSGDEAGMSLESASEPEILKSHSSQLNSSLDEAGLSLESSSDEFTLDSVTEEHDYETVQAKLPPQKHITSFLLSEVSSGKKMRTKATSLFSIKSAMSVKCVCGSKCLKKVSVQNVREIRRTFWSNSKTVRMQLLKYYISNSEKHGKFRFFSVGKLSLCSKAFCAIYGINKNTFSRGLEMERRNVATLPGNNPRTLAESTLLLMNWLEDYGTYHGDRMPDSVDILLPYKTVKADLFGKYKIEVLRWSQHPVSRSQFFKIWDKYFPHLKIKKTNSFSKCTTCTTLEKQLEKTTCVQTRARYKQMKDDHNQRQMMERKYYYGKRDRSRKNPALYLSMIVDGMDQAKTNLPHFAGCLPKNIKGTDLLKTHVTGVINHGHGGFHTFLDLNEYPHDPNLTLNVLLKMLKRTAEENENKLPPTFYIQADNSPRENKNRYVLAFCELLVREKFFTEVHLSFLYVGHTHEDVDAGFSQIAEKLRKTDVEVVGDLMDILPKSVKLTDMFDIKSWLSPQIQDLSGVSEPLHFKFQRVDNRVANFYKGQHSSSWINMDNILASVPTGEATLRYPDYSKIDCPKLLKQAVVVKELFKKKDSLETWRQFYSAVESQQRTPSPNPEWILKSLPRQTDVIEDDIDLPEDVRKLIEKDIRIPTVVVKKRKQPRQTSANSRRVIGKSGNQKKQQNKRGKSSVTLNRRKQQQSKRSKSTVKGSMRKRVTTQLALMLIPVTEDVKKHIWLMIFLDLLENYVLLCLLLLIILMHLRLFCLMGLLNYLRLLFHSLVLEHTGAFTSSVYKIENTFELNKNLICNVTC